MRGGAGARVGAHLFLALVLVLSVFPILWAVLTSLKATDEIYVDPYGLPEVFRWANYAEAWVIGKFSRYTINTVLLTVPTVLLVVGLALTTAFALSRTRIRWSRPIFLFFLFGLMVPIHGYMVPMFYNLRGLGLVDTRTGAVLAMTAIFLPFAVFLMRSAIADLPSEIFEAAVIDGARPAQVLWHIVLPLVRPAILALVVLQTIWTWNELVVPLLTLHDDELRPVSVGLTFFQTRFSFDYGLTAAGTIISAAPLILVYILFQRHFVRGILAGSMKG